MARFPVAVLVLTVIGVFGVDEVRGSAGLSLCNVGKCKCNGQVTEVKCNKPNFPKSATEKKIFVPDSAASVSIEGGSGLQHYLDSGLLYNLHNLQNLSIINSGIVTKARHFAGLTSLKSLQLTPELGQSIPAEALQPLTSIESTRNPWREKGRLLVRFHRHRNLADKCKGGDCYKACGDPGYLNISPPTVGVINIDKKNPTKFEDQHHHAMYFDLHKLYNKYGRHFVWAQFVTTSKPLKTLYNPPYVQRIYVVTRDFYFGKHGYTHAGWKPTGNCAVRLLKTGNGDNWYVVKFSPGLTVIAQRIYMKQTCVLSTRHFTLDDSYIVEKLLNGITSIRLEYLRAVSYCAKAKGQGDSSDDSVSMLNWALDVMSWLPKEKTISYYTKAVSAKNDLESKSEGRFFVPSLTREVYGRILDLQYRLAKSYKDEYDQFLEARNDRKFQRTLMGLMKEEAKNLAGATEVDFENAKYALKTSKVAITSLKKNFEETKPKLEAARKKFEAGIVAYGAHETARGIFGVFKAIKGIFTGKVLEGVEGLWNTFERMVKMIRTLDRVIKANAEMMKFVEGQGMTVEDERQYLRDVEKAAQLTVNIVEWRNMVTAVEILLQEGDAAGIIGSRGYRRRLQELAEWGEALSKETIRQTDLLRRYLALEAALRARERYGDTVEDTMSEEKIESVNENKLIEAVALQMTDMKWIITDTLNSYCRSFFYYHLNHCSPKIQPKLSDTLTELTRKVHKAKIESLESLALVQATQPIDINIIVKDKGNCSTDSSDSSNGGDKLHKVQCPVSNLKESNSLVYKIGHNEGNLKWMSRVRVTEISVEFIGLKMEDPDQSLFVSISSVGDFEDHYKDKVYNFTMAPLKKGFVYNPSTNKISMRAKVHQSQGNLLQEISPFTTWMFNVNKDMNAEFDMSQVSKVKIRIQGSGVSRFSFTRKQESGPMVVNIEH